MLSWLSVALGVIIMGLGKALRCMSLGEVMICATGTVKRFCTPICRIAVLVEFFGLYLFASLVAERDMIPKPHGNSRNSIVGYTRLKKSVINSVAVNERLRESTRIS